MYLNILFMMIFCIHETNKTERETILGYTLFVCAHLPSQIFYKQNSSFLLVRLFRWSRPKTTAIPHGTIVWRRQQQSSVHIQTHAHTPLTQYVRVHFCTKLLLKNLLRHDYSLFKTVHRFAHRRQRMRFYFDLGFCFIFGYFLRAAHTQWPANKQHIRFTLFITTNQPAGIFKNSRDTGVVYQCRLTMEWRFSISYECCI